MKRTVEGSPRKKRQEKGPGANPPAGLSGATAIILWRQKAQKQCNGACFGASLMESFAT